MFTANAAKPHITSAEVDRAALASGRLRVRIGFKSPFPLTPPVVGIILQSKYGQPISGSNGRMQGEQWTPAPLTEGIVTAEIPRLPLHSDTYRISLFLGDAAQDYDEKRDALEFDFVSPQFYPQTPRLDVIGPVDLPWQWSVAPGPATAE